MEVEVQRLRVEGVRAEVLPPLVEGGALWELAHRYVRPQQPLLAYLLKPNTTEYVIPCLDRARLGLIRDSTFLIFGWEQIVVARHYKSYRQTWCVTIKGASMAVRQYGNGRDTVERVPF